MDPESMELGEINQKDKYSKISLTCRTSLKKKGGLIDTENRLVAVGARVGGWGVECGRKISTILQL